MISQIPKINYGTWHSIVIMSNRFFELLSLQRKLYPNPYYKFQYKLPYRYTKNKNCYLSLKNTNPASFFNFKMIPIFFNRPITYCEEVRSWCINLPFPDARVMERTQRHKYYNEKRRPVQVQAFMRTPNIFVCLLMCLGSLLLLMFSQFKFGLRLLEKVIITYDFLF